MLATPQSAPSNTMDNPMRVTENMIDLPSEETRPQPFVDCHAPLVSL